MERVGHVWKVRPGRAADYAERHREIWPELEALLREAGVVSYTIYLHGETLFSHMEVEDYAAMVERFNGDPIAARWEAWFAELMEYPNADPETGWPERLMEVWTL